MLARLLADHTVPFKVKGEHHHATTGFLQSDCPFCSPRSGKFRLGLPPRGKTAVCWSCGKHSLYEALLLLTGASPSEVIECLKNRRGGISPAPEATEGKFTPPPLLGELQAPHRKYLESRRLCPDEMSEVWGLRGIGISSRLSWRVWLPVLDEEGKEASWTTRTISPLGEPRYINARPDEERKPLKSLLFGAHLVKHACVVVEGPFSAMRVGPGTVALMGAKFTKAQVRGIASFSFRVVCLDSDETGRKASERLCSLLEGLPGKTLKAELESAKSPDDALEWEIKELRRLLWP